jgi:cystathionine beta-lyase
VYAPFLNSPEFQGRPLIRVPLDETNGWAIDFDAMEAAVTPETRLFVLCHPHNPVGRVYSTTDLEKIGDFCLRHNLILCADEIHCDLVYGETPFVSTATISKEIEDISMTMMSASKTYNLPGLSCAYMIIPNTALRNRFRRVCRGVITEVNTLGYTGLLAAYKYGEPWRIQLLDYLKGNVDYFYQAVQEQLAPLIMAPMDATYLAWLDARALPVDNPQRFFEEHGVGYSDGYDFYEGYGLDKPPKREKSTHGFIRANLGCPRSMIEETVARTAKAIAQL